MAKIKVKGYKWVDYRVPEIGDYIIMGGGMQLVSSPWIIEWIIQTDIFEKKKKQSKWVDATVEEIRRQGYEWGETIPCKVADSEKGIWHKGHLVKIDLDENYPFQIKFSNLAYKLCKIKRRD